MTTKHYKVSDRLFLIEEPIQGTTTKVTVGVTHHIACVDCSGSMYDAIPRIREDLKKKLPTMLSEKDTFSLIWFSGRGQYGVILEGEPVATLPDLQRVNQAI